jgi:hypothetical protein
MPTDSVVRRFRRAKGTVCKDAPVSAQDGLTRYLTDRWLADCTLYGPAGRIREGVEQWRDAGITTPVLVPLSPDGNQMNGLKAVFAAFEC